MIRAILVDDEPSNSQVLREILLRYCPSVSVVGIAENLAMAASMIYNLNPQLIFLDIQMPDGNGFDLIEQLETKKPAVIFVTAYEQFVLQALRCSAMDYLLKPLDIPNVIAAVDRSIAKLADVNLDLRLEVLLESLKKPFRISKIIIPAVDRYIFLNIYEIIRFEARGAYTEVLTNTKSFLVSKNIKEYEQTLPGDTFFRVHHSHIININFVKCYHKGKGGGSLEMNNGNIIEVSVRKKDEFLSRFR